MKYIIIFFFTFSIIQPVSAARLVPGSVPKVQPLLPAPTFIQPNLSGNVNFSGGGRSANPGAAQPETPAGAVSPSQPNLSRPGGNEPTAPAAAASWSTFTVIWLIVLALLIYGGLLLRKWLIKKGDI